MKKEMFSRFVKFCNWFQFQFFLTKHFGYQLIDTKTTTQLFYVFNILLSFKYRIIN